MSHIMMDLMGCVAALWLLAALRLLAAAVAAIVSLSRFKHSDQTASVERPMCDANVPPSRAVVTGLAEDLQSFSHHWSSDCALAVWAPYKKNASQEKDQGMCGCWHASSNLLESSTGFDFGLLLSWKVQIKIL